MRSRIVGLLLVVICMVLPFALVKAQTDKVYIKDKSIILGKVESLQADSVLIKFNDNKLWINTADVNRISIKGKDRNDIDYALLDSLNKSGFKSGFQKTLTAGLLGEGDLGDGRMSPSFALTGIYRFNKLLQFGVAIGFEQTSDINSIPVYAYYKGELFRHRSGPFYYAGYGYSKTWVRTGSLQHLEEVNGGSILKLGFGFIFDTGGRTDIISSVGWHQQKVEEEHPVYYTWMGESKMVVNRNMNRLEVRIGICF